MEEQLIKEYYSNITDKLVTCPKTKHEYYMLPICQMNGVNVDITLKSYKGEGHWFSVTLVIEAMVCLNKLWSYDDDDEDRLLHKSVIHCDKQKSEEEIREFTYNAVSKLINSLETLEYNKRNGKFDTKENNEIENKKLILQETVFSRFKNIKMTSDHKECCVCFERTSNLTACKHNLCLVCVTKLSQENKNSCPMCRGEIFMTYEDEDEDE